MTSPLRRTGSTNSVSTNENEVQYPVVREYECVKGLKRIQGFNKEQMQNAKDLGVLVCGVSLLLSDKHLEFCAVFDTKSSESNSRYHGFYFCGQLKNLEKCIQKKYLNLFTIYTLIHKNITKKPTSGLVDPYACPVLIVGDSQSKGTGGNSQAFWQISAEEGPTDKIIGFIPLLHRTDVFHTIKSLPLLSFEGESHQVRGPQFIFASTVDRNVLLPEYVEFDSLYTQTLHAIFNIFKEQKCNLITMSQPKRSAEQTNHNNNEKVFNVKELSQKLVSLIKNKNLLNNLYFAVGLSLYKKGQLKDIDMASLRVSPNGRAYFVQIMHTFAIAESDYEDTSKLKSQLDLLSTDLKELRNYCSKGVAIYNPFLMREEQSKKEPVLIKSAFAPKTTSTTPGEIKTSGTMSPALRTSADGITVSNLEIPVRNLDANRNVNNNNNHNNNNNNNNNNSVTESLLQKLERSLTINSEQHSASTSPVDVLRPTATPNFGSSYTPLTVEALMNSASILEKLERSMAKTNPNYASTPSNNVPYDQDKLVSAVVKVLFNNPQFLQKY